MTMLRGAGVGADRGGRSRGARRRIAALAAAALVAATGMVAFAAPASAAPPSPDTIAVAPDLSLDFCPSGTRELADSVIGSTTAATSYSFSKNGLVFPPSGDPYGLVSNDGLGHITFSSPTIPITAVAINVDDAARTHSATGLAGWATPVTSGDLSSVVSQAFAAATISHGSVGMYFCTPALGLSTTSLEMGATVPGSPAAQHAISITNTTGVAQQVSLTCTDPSVRVGWFAGASFQAACPQPSAHPTPGSDIGMIYLADGGSATLYVTLAPGAATAPGRIFPSISVQATPIVVTGGLQGPYYPATQTTSINLDGIVVDPSATPLYFADGALDLGSVPAGSESPWVPVTVTNGTSDPQQFSVSWATSPSPFDVDTTAVAGPNSCGAPIDGLIDLAAGASCVIGVRAAPGVDPSAVSNALDYADNVTGSLTLTVENFGHANDAHLPVTWFPPVHQVYGAPAVQTVTTSAGPISVPVTFGYRPSINDAPATWGGTVALSTSDPVSASNLALLDPTCTFTNDTCTVTVTGTLPAGQSLHGVLTVTTTAPGDAVATANVDLTVNEFHPANDDLANAEDLTTTDPTLQVPYSGGGPIASATGDTTGATTQANESLVVPSGRDMEGSTVWYHFVPKVSGLVSASTSGAVSVNVYSSGGVTATDVRALTELSSLPLDNGISWGNAWYVVKDHDYWMQVGTSSGASPGQFNVQLDETTDPQPSVLDLSAPGATPYSTNFPGSVVAVGPGSSVAAPLIFQVPSGPDVTVRFGVSPLTDNSLVPTPDTTLTVWEFADPAMTAIPAGLAGGQSIDPALTDPLGTAGPWDNGPWNAFTLKAGHSYVITATNTDLATTEFAYPWIQMSPVGPPPPPPTGPSFAAVTNVSVDATDATGATTTFTPPTAQSPNGFAAPVTCTPADSTTHWPIGVTTVTCTATDYTGTSSVTLTVTVKPVKPTAPHVATVTASTDSLTATWSPPVWDGGSPVTSYTVTVTKADGTPVATDLVQAPKTTDTIALPTGAAAFNAGTELKVGVVATTSIGDSPTDTTSTFLAPAGAVNSASGSNGVPAAVGYTAGSTSYTTSATGTGQGTVVVSNYPAGTTPGGTVPFSGSTAPLFDVVVDRANAPATVTISTCPAPSSGRLWWFQAATGAAAPGKWLPVNPAATVSAGCLTFTATAVSKPSVSDLSGTVFAVADPPASGTLTAADASVLTGGSTTVTVHVVDASDQPVASSSVTLSDGQSATTDGNGDAVFTVTSSVDGAVTYTAIADGISLGAQAVVTYGTAPVITPPSVGDGVTGSTYSFDVTATGSPTWSSSTLPGWLTIDPSSGTVSGTPTAAGTTTATLVATNAFGSSSVDVTIHVYDPVTVTTTSLPDTYVGAAYSPTVAAIGDTGSFTWSATGLPLGLSIDPFTGAISGAWSNAGSTTVTVTAKGTHVSASKDLMVQVYAALAPTDGVLPDAGVGTPYSTTLTATGGKGPITWSATGLPSTLTLAPSTGVISGTPTSAVTAADVTITAHDALGQSVIVHRAITVYPSVAITAPSAVTAEVGSALVVAPSATGGRGAITWSATGLPAWASIDSTSGRITGTPSAADVSASALSVKVTASSSLGAASATIALTVHAALAITTASLPAATSGAAYSTTLASSGGVPTVTWSATGLPTGLTLSAAGVISGSTTVTGPATVAVTATDALGVVVTTSLTLTVNAVTPPPAGQDLGLKLTASTFQAGESGSLTATVRNTGTTPVTAPITIRVTLPTGLTFRRASGTGWVCTTASALPSGQVVTCVRTGSLAAGASWSVSLTALPQVRAGTVLVVSSAVSTTAADPTPLDDVASVSITVRRG